MKKMMVSLLVLAAMLSAAIVPADRAQKVAENYYRNYAPAADKGNTVQNILTKEYMGQPTWYVVQFTEGWVIVSAEDTARPVLGYSFDGIITDDLYNTRNPFINRFDAYDKQIVHDFRAKGVVDQQAVAEWKDIENNIFPKATKAIIVDALLETNWGQGWPWNDLCPTGTPVGCVATAMHMIMRFHQGPAQGYGSHSYNDIWGSTTGSHSVDFSTAVYDWSLMQALTSGQVSTQAQADEMAELSYHCGVAVDMDYETDGSGAYISDVPSALETYFDFSTDATYGTPGTVTNVTTYASTIQGNLDLYRPLEWGGSGPDGGHAFVLDGYTDDYWYHFNWGWDGAYNGWFQLTALTPGGSDFSSSQNCAYNLYVAGLADEWPPPENLAGVLTNGEDVALSWDRPTGVKLGTLTGYEIYRNGVLIGSVGQAVESYNDYDLSQGNYTYTVKATYTTPDGTSPISNAYNVIVTANTNFPVATALSAVTMGRTSIDLTWVKPYTGQIYYSCDFETITLATNWKHERTTKYPPTGTKINKVLDNFNKADITDGWFQCDESSFGDPQYIHGGTYSMAIGYTTPEITWAFSPQFTISNSDAHLYYWHWITGNAANNWVTNSYVNLYTGTFTETNPSLYLTEIAAYVGIDETTENIYDTQVDIDLTAYTGTYRIAWVYEYTDGYQMAVDDIIIGSAMKSAPLVSEKIPHDPFKRHATGVPADVSNIVHETAPKADNPTGYQVYRNGSLAATINDGNTLSWSDTGFADGWNEYFVKTVYPTGTSIASDRDYAYIIQNPVPGYLTGVLNANQADVDLSWYAPLHLPPHWFGYTDDSFESYFDNIDGMTGSWAERRTVFTAARLGLGYEYPFTVDSVAAAFYEDAAMPWTDAIFQYEVWTTNVAGTADSTIWGPSTDQTATSGFWHTLGLPSQLTMNWGWYVSTHVNTNGTPSAFVNVHDASGSTASSVYYGGDGTYDAGWYSISYGDGGDPGDWAIICFGQGSVDTWFYNKAEAPVEKLTLTPVETIKGHVKPELDMTTQNSKAMVKYNVWRNGVDIADVTSAASPINYTDVAAPAGDNTYYITAVYSDPAGESVASESVMVNVPGSSTPDTPTNVVTSVVSGQVLINWDDMAGATSYNVYSSANPYGTYTLLTNVTSSQYTYTGTETKMFFQITSSNSKAAAPRTIEIAKPASKR